MPTSRKSTMVSRLLANPSIQISHRPPGGRRERLGAIPPTRRRNTDKHVTNGVGGSKVEGHHTSARLFDRLSIIGPVLPGQTRIAPPPPSVSLSRLCSLAPAGYGYGDTGAPAAE